MEAVNGTTKDVMFWTKDVCGTCSGSKCKPGTSPEICAPCGGTGAMSYRQGPMQIQMACSVCGGAGKSIKSPCSTCKGTGTAAKTIKETITIPKGVSTG